MTTSLSPAQLSALLDILTHYDTYAEIRDFRRPGALDHYGPPFTAENGSRSSSPALQALLSRFVLNLPGLKNVPDDFWKVQVHQLIESLEEANLSESYDKGSVGSRKTLSTAVSALIEYPVRGTFGGIAELGADSDIYDLRSAKDLARGFRNFVDQCIFGTVLEDLVKKAAETDKLEEHSNSIKAVHEFVLVNLASFMHYTLILSPKGQYLLKLIDNANKLIPYLAIRQTLRIGNIATMISALTRIILAKMSVASLTNWIGLTATDDDGINLLQQIVSTVLHWDIRDLESRVSKIEKDKACPSKAVLEALNSYVSTDAAKQDELRKHSQMFSISIVLTILADAGKPSDMTEQSHKLALDYLACKLAVRDRKEIIRVACYSRPDHLTVMVRALVDAYEPVIRQFHEAVDLSDTVADFQAFITDMLKIAKIQPTGRDGQTVVPTVGDFVQLLRKHQYSSHKFIHQLCKNGKEVVGWYLDWAKTAASKFERDSFFVNASEAQGIEGENHGASPETSSDAGSLNKPLQKLFQELPKETQKQILPVLDQTVLYIDEMHASSIERLANVIKSTPTGASQSSNSTIHKVLSSKLALSRPNSRPGSRSSSPARTSTPTPGDAQAQTQKSSTTASHSDPSEVPRVSSDPGPGAYLARWQDLLDSTPITPLTAHGKPARASDKAVVDASATDVNGGKMVEFEAKQKTLDAHKVKPNVPGGGTDGKKRFVKKPDVKIVVDALGKDFRKLLAEKSMYW